MQILVCRDKIIIKQAWDTRTLTYLVRELSTLLKEAGYEPVLNFTGSPIITEGGIAVDIKLNRGLSNWDLVIVKRILEAYSLSVQTC